MRPARPRPPRVLDPGCVVLGLFGYGADVSAPLPLLLPPAVATTDAAEPTPVRKTKRGERDPNISFSTGCSQAFSRYSRFCCHVAMSFATEYVPVVFFSLCAMRLFSASILCCWIWCLRRLARSARAWYSSLLLPPPVHEPTRVRVRARAVLLRFC